MLLTNNCCLGTQDGVLIPIYTDRNLWMLCSGKPNLWNVHDKSGLTEGHKCTKMSLLGKIRGVINDWIRWCSWSLLTSKLCIVISTSFPLYWTYVPFITFGFLFPLSVIFIFLSAEPCPNPINFYDDNCIFNFPPTRLFYLLFFYLLPFNFMYSFTPDSANRISIFNLSI